VISQGVKDHSAALITSLKDQLSQKQRELERDPEHKVEYRERQIRELSTLLSQAESVGRLITTIDRRYIG
jgi:hypothetical protein